jgi:hypothetical protein
MMQTWAALVLLLLFVVVFSLAQPYEETYLNHLERGALSINIITLLFGLGLFTNDQAGDDAKSGALAMLITIGIVGCNLFFVFSVGRTLFTHSQYCAVCKSTSRTKGKLHKQRSLTVFLDSQRAKNQSERSDRKAYAALKLQQSIQRSMGQSAVVVVPSGGGGGSGGGSGGGGAKVM